MPGTPPPAANSLRPDIPDELVAVLERMIAKDPADRFQIPAEVAEAVAPLCSGANLAGLFALDDLPSYSKARASPAPPRSAPEAQRGWLAARSSLPLLGLAILAAAGVWYRMSTSKPPEVVARPEVVVQQAVLFVVAATATTTTLRS